MRRSGPKGARHLRTGESVLSTDVQNILLLSAVHLNCDYY